MKTILIVDDEIFMRQIIEDSLSHNYDVTSVSNGQEALDTIKNTNFDLIITDLVMPEMNGIDLVMNLKKINPTQKIIAISGGGGISGRFDYLPVAELLGANNVLRKPFEISVLRNTVDTLLSDSYLAGSASK